MDNESADGGCVVAVTEGVTVVDEEYIGSLNLDWNGVLE